VESSAYSVWARPRTSIGFEGLLRYDSVRPDRNAEARRSRRIVGVGYWFKTPPSVSAALLTDYERATFGSTSTRPAETRLALHCLFAF
jgi:hypothetical protein